MRKFLPVLLALLPIPHRVLSQAPPPSVTGPGSMIDTNLLNELRITLPDAPDGGRRGATPSRVLVAPRLTITTGTNTTASAGATEPIPLLRGAPGPEVSRHMMRAIGLMSTNQVYLASRELWQATRLGTGLTDPASGLALMYLLAEDNDRAANLLEKLTAANPQQTDLWFNLAAARYGQGRFAEAASILKTILDRDRYPATILYNLGMCQAAQGLYDEALQTFAQAKEKAPRNPAAAVAMARVQAIRNRSAEAIALLVEAAPLLGREGLRDVLLDDSFRSVARDAGLLAFLRGEKAP